MPSDLEAKRLAVLRSLTKKAPPPPSTQLPLSLPPPPKPYFDVPEARATTNGNELSSHEIPHIPNAIIPSSDFLGATNPLPNVTPQDMELSPSEKPANSQVVSAPVLPPTSQKPFQPPPPPPPVTSVSLTSPNSFKSESSLYSLSDSARISKPPTIKKKTPFEQAVYDLTRLGYGFWDIVKESNVNADLLKGLFQSQGYAIPGAKLSVPNSPMMEKTDEDAMPKPAVIALKSVSPVPQASAPLSNPSKPAPIDLSKKPTSILSQHTPKVASKVLQGSSFGSDRWSKSLNITLSDDEDIDEESDYSDDEAENSTTSLNTPRLTRSAVESTEAISSKLSDRTHLARSLEAQREKIRQVTAQLKLLEEQRSSRTNSPGLRTSEKFPNTDFAAASSDGSLSGSFEQEALSALKLTSPTDNQNGNSNGNSNGSALTSGDFKDEDKPENEQRVVSVKNSTDTVSNANVEISNSLAVSSLEHQGMVPSSKRAYSLAQSLERARQEHDQIENQKKMFLDELERNNTNQTKKQIEDLKSELERKMTELVEQTYAFASAKASLEATKVQEERLMAGISALEEQLSIEQNVLENKSTNVRVKEPLMIPYTSDNSNLAQKDPELPAIDTFAGTSESQNSMGNSSDSDVEIIDVNDHNSNVSKDSPIETKVPSKKRKSPALDLESESSSDTVMTDNKTVDMAKEQVTLAEKSVDIVEDEKQQVFKIKPQYFTPYVSPLKSFRSFRFSPFYKETVSDGYKSLTYSNSINQKRNLVCSNEIFQGVCKDKKCSNLHFAQMVPTDYDILADMSRAFIGDTPEDIEAYKESLFKTITDKGESAGFGVIADATVDFRRESKGGSDRILDWYKFHTIKKKLLDKGRSK